MITELWRAPLTFTAADGATLDHPLVQTRIQGVETRLVVDTASDVHLIVRSLADEIGLHLTEGEEGTDASGSTTPSWSGGPVRLEFGAVVRTIDEVVVIPAPPPFRGWGIGGILSPQLIHPRSWAVIDLMRDELVLVEATEQFLVPWLKERSPKLTALRLARATHSVVPVIRAAIPPYAEVPLLIDSGAGSTDVSPSVVPDLGFTGDQHLGAGISGTDIVGAQLGRQVLSVGGVEIPVPNLGVREGHHGSAGLIGMDVLRGTVIALNADRDGSVLWQVPADLI